MHSVAIKELVDIADARAAEQVLSIWTRFYMLYETADLNFRVARKAE